MKKSVILRTTAVFICIVMLLSTAISCAKENDAPDQTVNVTVESDLGDNLPERDMEGFQLTFLNYTDEAHDFSLKTLVTDDLGSKINEAIYYRNAYVENRFNAKIMEEQTATMTDRLQKSAMSGDEEKFQIAMIFDEKVNNSYINGSLSTWNNMTYCDFEREWWNTDACTLFSHNGNQYGAVGDFSLSMYSKDYCYFFNKDLYNSIPNAENIYDLVRNKQWTLDKMLQIGMQYTQDLNGDGMWYDGSDQYGIGGTVKVHYQMVFTGAGLKFINVRESGLPTFALNNAKSVEKLSNLIEKFNDTTCYYNSNPGSPTGGTVPDVFLDGKIVFFASTIFNFGAQLKETDFHLGILPAPMYDEEQDRYYSIAIGGQIACVARCIKESDVENVSILLEAMSAYSKDNLIPVYRETIVKTRYSDSLDDSEMLQLLFDTTVLDLGTTIWNNDVRAPIMKNLFAPLDTGVASYIKRMIPTVENAIKKSMDADVQ